ncbi:hypothetical protein KXR87_16885 [Yokenella regensburgei]
MTFGSQTQAIAAIYSLSPQKISASDTGVSNATIQVLLHTAQSGSSISSLGGAGRALLETLKENRGDFTQAVAATDTAPGMAPANKSAISLDITTRSGSTIHLSLTQQDGGVAVSMTTEGDALNDDEAEAVASLGKAFQSVLDGLGKQPPELDISGLTKFNSSVLRSIDLKTDVRNGDDSLQSLNFHSDSDESWVAYQDADFSLKMTSDRSQSNDPADRVAQQVALAAYDKQFDKARIDGKGDRNQMELMKSVFHALNTPQDETINVIDNPGDVRVGGGSSAPAKGLNDFSLSLTRTSKSINPARLDEKESFSYQASQTTEESRSYDGSRSVKQTAHNHLSASWYQPLDPSLPLSLKKDKTSQNYLYHTLENDEVNTTTLNYNAKGLLAGIRNQTQVNNLETMKKYVMGDLVDEIHTPEKYNRETLQKLLADL